ncbi:MAG: hypothetical protein HY553_03015 [Elusimicrobia bacterium]|nr:hypothetical protein [Elusimicrobiota bacterium]
MEGDSPPERDLGLDVGEIESIQSLDTARMTLRWALERLRALEKLNKELTGKADWEFKMRLKAEEDFKQQWEMEKAHIEAVQRQREGELERQFAAKLVEWERNYQEQIQTVQKQLREEADKAKADAEELRRKTAEEYNQKFYALERLEKQRLHELAEKEREFDRFCSLQKQHADQERRQIKGEAQREAEEQYKAIQKLTDDRLASLSATWQREKDSLLKDLDAWRRRAEEAVSRSLELERSARNAEDLARSATRLADERAGEYQRLNEAWDRQRRALEAEVLEAQERFAQLDAKTSELERTRRFTEAQAQKAAQLADDRQAESLKMVDSWERQRASLEENVKQWQRRALEADQEAARAKEIAADAKAAAEKIDHETKLRHADTERRLAERVA